MAFGMDIATSRLDVPNYTSNRVRLVVPGRQWTPPTARNPASGSSRHRIR